MSAGIKGGKGGKSRYSSQVEYQVHSGGNRRERGGGARLSVAME